MQETKIKGFLLKNFIKEDQTNLENIQILDQLNDEQNKKS